MVTLADRIGLRPYFTASAGKEISMAGTTGETQGRQTGNQQQPRVGCRTAKEKGGEVLKKHILVDRCEDCLQDLDESKITLRDSSPAPKPGGGESQQVANDQKKNGAGKSSLPEPTGHPLKDFWGGFTHAIWPGKK
jgi:hypothetical protein